MGTGTHYGADSLSGIALPHGRRCERPFPQWSFIGRLGHAVVADALSVDVRRYLVDVARSQRFPRLHRSRSLCVARQRLSQTRWHAVAAGARQGQGDRYLRAVRQNGTSARRLWRAAGLVRVGVLAARQGWTAGTDV